MKGDGLIAAHLGEARPHVIAVLLRRFRDLEIVEDGFQTAALRATRIWAEAGLPRDPTGWLVTVGRNAILDELRKRARDAPLPDDLPEATSETAPEEALDRAAFRDDVLRLFFFCCHPDLKAQDQMVLALRYVAGLGVEDLGRAFLIKPATLQRRLSRARERAETLGAGAETWTETGTGSEGFRPHDRASQLAQVHGVIYLMFNKGYAASHGQAHIEPRLCAEALRLARLLLQVFPQEAETMGLLSLILGSMARFPARLVDGRLVPLGQQDRGRWDTGRIAQARVLAQKALRVAPMGIYPLQAAICDVHNQAARAEETDWAEILRLYRVLEYRCPTPVVRLNRIVAQSRVTGPGAALEAMAELAGEMAGYLPFHATRAGLNEEAGRPEAALEATRHALDCDPSAEERVFLEEQLLRLTQRVMASDSRSGT